MYGKYTLFYESPKNWGYLRACVNSVYQASPRGEGSGDEARLAFEQHMENGTERAERCMVDCLLLMEVIRSNHDW